MERPPRPYHETTEQYPERILTSEAVLEAISQHVEGFTLSRELSDNKGIYLREVEVKGEEEGEVIEYQYMRKGVHGNHNESSVTAISKIYYQDGMPIGGERVAILNEETGEWELCRTARGRIPIGSA